jgi:hypothetical protein
MTMLLNIEQVQSQIYLLDFQALEGDAFSFMTLCAKVCMLVLLRFM